jgi:lycopene cyclase domain-containing protein
MSYTAACVVGVLGAVVLDMVVLRTRLVRRKAFWTAYAICLVFQLIVNGVLTGRRLVTYSPDTVLGPRLVYAPVEDLAFGFALVLQTLAWWVWWGRRERQAPTSPGTATDARLITPTRARRSSTE